MMTTSPNIFVIGVVFAIIGHHAGFPALIGQCSTRISYEQAYASPVVDMATVSDCDGDTLLPVVTQPVELSAWSEYTWVKATNQCVASMTVKWQLSKDLGESSSAFHVTLYAYSAGYLGIQDCVQVNIRPASNWTMSGDTNITRISLHCILTSGCRNYFMTVSGHPEQYTEDETPVTSLSVPYQCSLPVSDAVSVKTPSEVITGSDELVTSLVNKDDDDNFSVAVLFKVPALVIVVVVVAVVVVVVLLAVLAVVRHRRGTNVRSNSVSTGSSGELLRSLSESEQDTLTTNNAATTTKTTLLTESQTKSKKINCHSKQCSTQFTTQCHECNFQKSTFYPPVFHNDDSTSVTLT